MSEKPSLDEVQQNRFLEDMQPKSSKLIVSLVALALGLSVALSFWFSSFNFFVDRKFGAQEVIIEFELE